MSANVLGCGHTSHLRLFAIDVVTASPQVHLHFMTADEEYDELGYGKVEIVCHGCGASTLIYYTDDGREHRRIQMRDEFVHVHSKCPNRNYESACPDWRTSFKRVDLRQKHDDDLPVPRRRRQKMFTPTMRTIKPRKLSEKA